VDKAKTIRDLMTERGISLDTLIESTPLDRKVVVAIVNGQYTPSPQQRKHVAAALGIEPDQIAWGHTTEVQHIHGHGPQFGRSP
jgi:ribosome-binding protein aMBF1 (putative translation factor)